MWWGRSLKLHWCWPAGPYQHLGEPKWIEYPGSWCPRCHKNDIVGEDWRVVLIRMLDR